MKENPRFRYPSYLFILVKLLLLMAGCTPEEVHTVKTDTIRLDSGESNTQEMTILDIELNTFESYYLGDDQALTIQLYSVNYQSNLVVPDKVVQISRKGQSITITITHQDGKQQQATTSFDLSPTSVEVDGENFSVVEISRNKAMVYYDSKLKIQALQ